jgi:AraC-like DNA-binding protein
MDLLTDMLSHSRVRGTLGARIEAGNRWGVWWSDIPGAALHAVTAGVVWLGVPEQPPIQLMPGDVVLLTRGPDHSLSSEPNKVWISCSDAGAWQTRADGQVLQFGSEPIRSHMLSASYQHDPALSNQILMALPEIIHLRADHGASCLGDTVRLLGRELAASQLGAGLVLNRLIDILLVQVIRVWLANHPNQAHQSWLQVLNDPLISSALTKLHQEPSREWTTASLANELGISRATLARHFPAAVGQTPAAYLTQWRMDLAALQLRDSNESLEQIAAHVGYTSVYAFSRAFQRARGLPPGSYRQHARLQRPAQSTATLTELIS